MVSKTNFTLHIDSDVKRQAEEIFSELGIDLTTAINIFLRQSIRVGCFPFDIKIKQPNKKTIDAMLEAECICNDQSVKCYSNVEDALRALQE